MQTKECGLCHRIGYRGYVPWGSEGWCCARDDICRRRQADRAHPDPPRALAPVARQQWILDYIAGLPDGHAVSVVDNDVVTSYIAATSAGHTMLAYGAPRCRPLGRDLTALHHQELLDRRRVGISGTESGFPTGVWEYDHPARRSPSQPANPTDQEHPR